MIFDVIMVEWTCHVGHITRSDTARHNNSPKESEMNSFDFMRKEDSFDFMRKEDSFDFMRKEDSFDFM